MMPSDDLPVVEQSFERCRHLLSKGLMINAGLPKGQEVVGDGNFWCGQTQHVKGPDNGLCGHEECTTGGRGCYVRP